MKKALNLQLKTWILTSMGKLHQCLVDVGYNRLTQLFWIFNIYIFLHFTLNSPVWWLPVFLSIWNTLYLRIISAKFGWYILIQWSYREEDWHMVFCLNKLQLLLTKDVYYQFVYNWRSGSEKNLSTQCFHYIHFANNFLQKKTLESPSPKNAMCQFHEFCWNWPSGWKDENILIRKKFGSGELKISFNARWWSADVFNNILHNIEVTTYIYSHKIILPRILYISGKR